MPLGIKPTVDFAFKKIFGSEENTAILLGLLNAILELPCPIVHVRILNPFSYKDFEEEKQVVLDVRAKDSDDRQLNVEMQVAVFSGLLQRLAYYACRVYLEQLEAGQNYADLRQAISICLLRQVLFAHSPAPHHHFRLVDTKQGMELPEAIEVHTVELPKYNVDVQSLSKATPIERWVFFFLYADQYEPEQLRELLPDAEFQQAVTVIEAIAAKTEDRNMYDDREKAQRDYLWAMEGARKEGIEVGMEKGIEKGREEGREEGVVAGKIQLFQELLGEESSTTDSLLQRSMDELSSMLSDLQQRLRSRGE